MQYNWRVRFDQLEAHVKTGKYKPCYLLCGDDYGLTKMARDTLHNLCGDFSEFNLVIMNESATPGEIIEAAEQLPVGDGMRIVSIFTKDPAGLIDKELKNYFSNPSPYCIIIVTQTSESTKQVKNAETIDCNRLSLDAINRYLDGRNFSSGAATLLAQYCGRFIDRIRLEADKLAAYKNGAEITLDDVATLIKPDLDYKVYELTDAICKKDDKRALILLDDMLSDGANSWPKTFGLIYSYFRKLLYSSLSPSDPLLASNLDVKDAAARVYVRQSQSFTKLQLKELLEKLHAVDFGIKTGNINAQIALTTFVLEASSK